MIGNSLQLQETGAPTLDETYRLGRQGGLPGRISKTRLHLPLPALLQGLQVLRARWNPRPVRWWREIAALGLFLLGLSWSVPWFRALSAATQAVPSGQTFMVFAVIGAGAYFLTRVLVGFQLEARVRRNILLAATGLAVAAGLKTLLYAKEIIPITELVLQPLRTLANFTNLVPNEWIVMVAVVLMVRRGVVLAQDHIGPARAREAFINGFAMFLAFVALNTVVTHEHVPDAFLVLFIYSALAAMGAARMAAMEDLRGGRRPRFDRSRLIAMLIGVSLTAFLAQQIGFVFSRDGGVLAVAVIGAGVLSVFLVSAPLLIAVLYILYAILSSYREEASQALEGVLAAIRALLAFLDNMRTLVLELGVYLADRLAFLAPIFRRILALAPAVRIVLLAGAVVLPLLLVLAAMARRARRRKDVAEEGAAEDSGLGSLLARLRARAGGRFRGNEYRYGRFTINRDQILAQRVRRLYLKLIRLAEQLGHPMGASQTPDEFSRDLDKLIPGQRAAILVMTRAYEKVRYGELPEHADEVQRVRDAWLRIRRAVPRGRRSGR